MRNHILIFCFLSNLLSDGFHVCIRNGLQSATIIQYCWGYKCKVLLVWRSLTVAAIRNQILISYFLSNLFSDDAEAFNQPLYFNTTKVAHVRLYSFGIWPQWETRFWFPFSYPFYYQMFRMFFNAWDFNQDLCNFGDNMSQLSNSQITSITMGMFDNSGCSDKDPPTSASGPWCAVTSCPA